MGDEEGRRQMGGGCVDGLRGEGLSRKAPGEIFGGFRNIVMEQNLGGLGFFPPFFTVCMR